MKKHTLGLIATLVAGALNTAHADTLKMECASTSTGKAYCDYIKARFEKETTNKLECNSSPGLR